MPSKADKSKSQVRCPHCVSVMSEQMWGGVPFHVCMRCGANFFASGALAAWEGWKDDVPAEVDLLADREPVKFHCPGCANIMERLTIPLAPPLGFERCPSCGGIMLDFEEIRRIPEVGTWAASRVLTRSQVARLKK